MRLSAAGVTPEAIRQIEDQSVHVTIHSDERIEFIEKKQKLISMRLSAAGITSAVIRQIEDPSVHATIHSDERIEFIEKNKN